MYGHSEPMRPLKHETKEETTVIMQSHHRALNKIDELINYTFSVSSIAFQPFPQPSYKIVLHIKNRIECIFLRFLRTMKVSLDLVAGCSL